MMLANVIALLDQAPRHDPISLQSGDIPTVAGLYVWYRKADRTPAYVGKATGRDGLRHRIWTQHLNPRYLEGRPEKIRDKDSYQLARAVTVRGTASIDKSVLRRNIGRRERAAPGQPTVDFIRHHLTVSWIPLPSLDRAKIIALEHELIARFKPSLRYNLQGV